jgi:dihydropyrimidinase
MATVIRAGTIITAAETFEADLLIEGEQIQEMGTHLTVPSGATIVDAAGMLVMPGGVDAHTHFDLPMFGTVSSDDHYTGHKAAAFGATTTVIDFVPQENRSLRENVRAWRAKADPRAAVDFSFHMNITRWDEGVAAEVPGLLAEGITTLKVFTAYNNRLRLADDQILQVMRIAKRLGMVTMLHAENGDVIELLVAEALAARQTTPEYHAHTRPAWGAVEAVLRGAALSGQADGAPLYVVHMNAGGEVDMLAYARSQGLPVMGETCPQYLFFTVDDLRRPDGAKWICSPPMRTLTDNERLWEGLQDGTIHTIGTDHCPFFFDGTQPIEYEGQPVAIPGKELGAQNFTLIPNGLPGVGDRMAILWTEGVVKGRLSANRFVELNCTNPAKIFGLYPRKGSLMPGADADIVIWDPNQKVDYGVRYSHQRTDYNLYEGWQLTGFPRQVFLRGQMIVDGEQWHGRPGMGRFIPRKPFAPVL